MQKMDLSRNFWKKQQKETIGQEKAVGINHLLKFYRLAYYYKSLRLYGYPRQNTHSSSFVPLIPFRIGVFFTLVVAIDKPWNPSTTTCHNVAKQMIKYCNRYYNHIKRFSLKKTHDGLLLLSFFIKFHFFLSFMFFLATFLWIKCVIIMWYLACCVYVQHLWEYMANVWTRIRTYTFFLKQQERKRNIH